MAGVPRLRPSAVEIDVLVGFMSIGYKLGSSERRKPQLRKCLLKMGL